MEFLSAAEKIAAIVAAAATVAALYGILNQLKAARQDSSRRALDLIISILKSDQYVIDRQVFLRLKREEINIQFAAEATDSQDAVRRMLNAHEIIALYINDGLVDEKTAKKYMRGWFLDDWERIGSFVASTRKRNKNNDLYMQLEILMDRWRQTLS